MFGMFALRLTKQSYSLAWVISSWALALTMLVIVVIQARHSVESQTQLDALRRLAPAVISAEPTPVAPAELGALVERLKPMIAPSVAMTLQPGGIQVAADNLAAYNDWLNAVNLLLATGGEVRWATKSMCSGQQCPNKGFLIVISGQ